MGVTVSSSQVVSASPSSSRLSLAPECGRAHGRQFSTNFSNVSSSHGLLSLTNCSSMGHFHRVQSFRNRMLQCGSAMGPQILPANLHERGLLFPRIHRSCQDPAPAQAPHRITASFWHPPALVWDPPRAAGGYLFHHGPPWAVPWPASLWSSPWAVGQSLLQSLEHLLLLKYVITEVLPLLLIGLALASGRSILEPAVIGSIRLRGNF